MDDDDQVSLMMMVILMTTMMRMTSVCARGCQVSLMGSFRVKSGASSQDPRTCMIKITIIHINFVVFVLKIVNAKYYHHVKVVASPQIF